MELHSRKLIEIVNASGNLPTARRSHRVLAVYLVLHAWVNNLECVILDGIELREYLQDLSRLEGGRKENLVEDVKCYFPFHHWIPFSNTSPSLVLSRLELPKTVWEDRSHMYEIREKLEKIGVRAGNIGLPSEADIIALNALVIHGITNFVPLTRTTTGN